MLNHRNRGRFASVLLIFLLSGCVGAPSTIAPASTSALAITNLMWGFTGVAGLGFILVEGLLIYTIIRYRSKEGSHPGSNVLPSQKEGNHSLEIAWTIVPALLLMVIFIFTVSTLWAIKNRPSAVSADDQVVNINVTGHQWWWEFEYPESKITTAQEMHVPVNSLVFISVDSVDVIHSFWVPQMGGKIDVIPGHINQTWFQPTQTGLFVGECSEYCGAEHANMRLFLYVDTLAEYNAWVQQQQSAIPTLSGDAKTGEDVFLNGSCIGCHTIDGTDSMGSNGPNLTHIGGRQYLAGGVLLNNPENLARWLKDPSEVKPGVKMPTLDLSAIQIQQLVSFLESLK